MFRLIRAPRLYSGRRQIPPALSSSSQSDLGDPERFASLGELVYAAHRTIWEYNHTRIHLALRMPPQQFAEQQRKLAENYSKERGA